MKLATLLINGKIYDGQGLTPGCLGVAPDGTVALYSREVPSCAEAEQTVDLHGAWVLPGGIETHTHIREPELTERSDFASESAAAAAGGITTFFEMPIAAPPQATLSILQRREALAAEKSCVDFAFYGAAGGGKDNVKALAEAGVIGYKLFMFDVTGPRKGEFSGALAPDPASLAQAMEDVAETGKILALHAESGSLAQFFTARSRGLPQDRPLKLHEQSRPELCETLAVQEALSMARRFGTRLSICHISCGASMELIAKARAEGQEVYAETCPQYLWLDYDKADELGYGPYAKYNPPIRSPMERESLWKSLRRGEFDYVGSDHGAFRLDEKKPGERDIFAAPAGNVGFETRLPLMTDAVLKGNMTIRELVRLTSERAAQVFGLWPRKGSLLPGADADLTVVDPDGMTVPSPQTSLSRGRDIARLYEGWPLRGRVLHTMVRGRFVFRGGILCENVRGWGRKAAPR